MEDFYIMKILIGGVGRSEIQLTLTASRYIELSGRIHLSKVGQIR